MEPPPSGPDDRRAAVRHVADQIAAALAAHGVVEQWPRFVTAPDVAAVPQATPTGLLGADAERLARLGRQREDREAATAELEVQERLRREAAEERRRREERAAVEEAEHASRVAARASRPEVGGRWEGAAALSRTSEPVLTILEPAEPEPSPLELLRRGRSGTPERRAGVASVRAEWAPRLPERESYSSADAPPRADGAIQLARRTADGQPSAMVSPRRTYAEPPWRQGDDYWRADTSGGASSGSSSSSRGSLLHRRTGSSPSRISSRSSSSSPHRSRLSTGLDWSDRIDGALSELAGAQRSNAVHLRQQLARVETASSEGRRRTLSPLRTPSSTLGDGSRRRSPPPRSYSYSALSYSPSPRGFVTSPSRGTRSPGRSMLAGTITRSASSKGAGTGGAMPMPFLSIELGRPTSASSAEVRSAGGGGGNGYRRSVAMSSFATSPLVRSPSDEVAAAIDRSVQLSAR